MKMVKKFLIGLIAVSTVLALSGCKPLESGGDGELEGDKWEAVMTVDNSEADPNASTKIYNRYWKQFGTAEKVQAITTTAKFDGQASDPGNSVAGFVFDLNKNSGNTVDFCLVGISYRDGGYKYYFERYVNVPTSKTQTEAGITDSSLGDYYTYTITGNSWSTTKYTPSDSVSDWKALPSSSYTMDATTGDTTMVFSLTQANGVYTVKIGNTTIGTYGADSINGYVRNAEADKNGNISGGIACYGNAYPGKKIVVKYANDKESLVGKLFAEDEE